MTDAPVCRRLTGRVAVITGAGAGLGLAVAQRLAAEGAKVVCADIDEAAGGAAARRVGGLFVHTDVTDPYMVEALYDEAYERYGGVDVAFNNAGVVAPGSPSAGPLRDPGLASVELCCRFALPYMRRHGRGSVINTAGVAVLSSSAGEGPAEGPAGPAGAAVCSAVAFAAAKGGVLELSRSLGSKYAREGIRVNALALAAGWEEGAARIPLGRFARAEEIAAAVAFLASDDASFVTASELTVDGGSSVGCFSP